MLREQIAVKKLAMVMEYSISSSSSKIIKSAGTDVLRTIDPTVHLTEFTLIVTATEGIGSRASTPNANNSITFHILYINYILGLRDTGNVCLFPILGSVEWSW